MNSRYLSRRTLLRGAGVGGAASVALPLLDAMCTIGGKLPQALAAEATPPKRLITYFFANGYWGKFSPDTEGTNFALPECLTTLAKNRQHITVVSGLKCTAALHKENDVHGNGSAAFATGMPSTVAGPDGPSIDQIAARVLAPPTKFRSLQYAADADCKSPFNCNHSWSAAKTPVQPERSPAAAFARLFPDGGATDKPAADQAAKYKRSVLDFVLADVGRLDAKLSGADKAKLDQHLTSIRELERQLAAEMGGGSGGGTNGCNASASFIAPTSHPVIRLRMMFKLIALAMSCDLTRIVSLASAGAISGIGYKPWIQEAWDTDHHHSHDGPHSTVVKITQFKMQLFSEFLDELKNVQEGDGTLLDNSLIYCSSEISQGSSHGKTNMPVLLAGKAGGAFKTGRHVRYPNVSTCNLLASVLNYAGVPTEKFGFDGTGPLAGL